MDARLSFRCDPTLVEAVDKARGLVSRELWLRKTVHDALGIPLPGRQKPSKPKTPRKKTRTPPKPSEPPRESEEKPEAGLEFGDLPELEEPTDMSPKERRQAVYRQHVPGPDVSRMRSSTQVKRDITPIPKKPKK